MTDPRFVGCAERLQVAAADALHDAQALTRVAVWLLGDNEDRRSRAVGILKKYANADRYGADEAAEVIEALEAIREAPKLRKKAAKQAVRRHGRSVPSNIVAGPWEARP